MVGGQIEWDSGVEIPHTKDPRRLRRRELLAYLLAGGATGVSGFWLGLNWSSSPSEDLLSPRVLGPPPPLAPSGAHINLGRDLAAVDSLFWSLNSEDNPDVIVAICDEFSSSQPEALINNPNGWNDNWYLTFHQPLPAGPVVGLSFYRQHSPHPDFSTTCVATESDWAAVYGGTYLVLGGFSADEFKAGGLPTVKADHWEAVATLGSTGHLDLFVSTSSEDEIIRQSQLLGVAAIEYLALRPAQDWLAPEARRQHQGVEGGRLAPCSVELDSLVAAQSEGAALGQQLPIQRR